MSERSVVGDLINFRGMVYSPVNENGVVFLFGKVVEDLNMYIEEIKPGYPDCIARRFVGNGWQRLSIEFELKASNFMQHKHDPRLCDAIVCWDNDLSKTGPLKEIEVIELKSLIKELPNREIQRPQKGLKTKDDEANEKAFISKANESARKLYYLAHDTIQKLDEAIWRNWGVKYTSYYCPQRVFTYLRMQKNGIRVLIFTGGEKLEGVTIRQPKWGVFTIKTKEDISKATKNWKKSLAIIRDAVKKGENTGWYANIEEDDAEDEDDNAKDSAK
jgi:hypothetical protein